MAVFFVIFDRQENGSKEVAGTTVGSAKILPSQPRIEEKSARWSGSVESAKVVKMEAGSAEEAKLAIGAMFPGSNANTANTVLEANFIER